MSQICVTFRSITAAQNAARALEQAGLLAQVLRTPRALQEQGCGYCVRAPAEPDAQRIPVKGTTRLCQRPDLDASLPVRGPSMRATPSPEGCSPSAVSFSGKMAIRTCPQISGREHRSPGKRKAVKESMRRDTHLARHKDMRALRRGTPAGIVRAPR